jgi:predicted glycosyltransferase involved in capsule biosynthesis
MYINNYENTSLEKLTDKIFAKIINEADEAYQIIPRLIKHIHCNPDIPENHNIRISNRNKNNKYLEVYRNNHWEIEDKKSEIGNLIYDKETNISDWTDEKGDKYPEVMEKFNEYLERKHDEPTASLIKEEVEILLYNNRNLINHKL